jgi:uncharacterized protein (DUF2384 family)
METGYLDKFHYRTLNRIVVTLVGDKLSGDWWNSPNRAFEDRKPIDLMNEAEWTRVRNYLMDHAYGGQYG